MAEHKKYRAWYIPQVPGKAFEVETDSLAEAVKIENLLVDFSIFEYDNHIKPDYSDAGGVDEWDEEEGEWSSLDEDEVEEKLRTAGDL
jgi:hypothetical protein